MGTIIKNKKSGNVLMTVLLTLLLYIHFHAPIYHNSIFTFRYLFIFAFLYVAFNLNAFSRYMKVFRKEMTYVAILIAYCAIRTLLGGEQTFFVMWIRSIFEFFFIPFTIIHIMFRNKQSSPLDIQRLLLIVGCVGAVITISCILYPPFNAYVKAMWTVVEDDGYLASLTYRCFGISDNLTYSYGIVQGIILLIGLLAIKKIKWILPFLPFIAISILLNARTGFVIAMAGYAIYLLLQKSEVKSKLTTIIGVALGALVVVYFITANVDEDGIAWLMDFFNEFGNARAGNLDETTLGALTGKMAIWPEGLEQWLIGRGHLLFRTNQHNTDVGFFLQLNYGGLIYVIPLYLFVISMALRIKKTVDYKVYAYILLATFVIANLKGDFIPYCGGFRLIVLYYCFIIYSRHQHRLVFSKNNVSI